MLCNLARHQILALFTASVSEKDIEDDLRCFDDGSAYNGIISIICYQCQCDQHVMNDPCVDR